MYDGDSSFWRRYPMLTMLLNLGTALVFWIAAVGIIQQGRFGLGRFGAVIITRADQPRWFWIGVSVSIALGVAFASLGISEFRRQRRNRNR